MEKGWLDNVKESIGSFFKNSEDEWISYVTPSCMSILMKRKLQMHQILLF
jgi:hypothetical protein